MDLLPISFLLLLALISGLIALAADELGRKLGKKRLSFAGLRPKHTAKLGTFVLGVVVSLFSIVFVSLLSSDVRQWILEGRQAIHDRNARIQELNEATAELEKSQRLEQDEKITIRSLQKQRGDLNFQLSREEINLRAAQAKTQALEQQESLLQGQLRLTNISIQEKNRLILANQRKLDDTRQRLSDLQKTMAVKVNESLTRNLKLHEQNQDLQASIADRQKTVDDLTKQMSKLNQDLGSTQTDLNEMTTRAAQEQQHLSELRLEVAKTDDQLDKANEQLAKANEDLKQDANYFDSVIGPSRELPMTFSRGQEVAVLPVPDHLSETEAQNALANLLKTASAIAETRGARPRSSYQAADIMVHEETADQRRSKVVQALIGKENPMVLVATADLNAFEGEPVSLEVQVKENPWVFKKGEVVAESRIDGALPFGDIYQAMSHFLGDSIRSRAKEKHMIGDLVDESPVPQKEFMQTLLAIKQAGHPVWLRAVAMDDTHAADPLKLDLQVR